MFKEVKCKTCKNGHLHNIICSEERNDRNLGQKLKLLCAKVEIKNFVDKRNQFMRVFGNSILLLNPMKAQCCLCGDNNSTWTHKRYHDAK